MHAVTRMSLGTEDMVRAPTQLASLFRHSSELNEDRTAVHLEGGLYSEQAASDRNKWKHSWHGEHMDRSFSTGWIAPKEAGRRI